MLKILWLLMCVFPMGCNYSLSKTPLQFREGQGSLEQIPSGTIMSYAFISKNIIGPKCLECHSKAGGDADGMNLETYENISANLGIIRSEVATDSMPKNRTKLSLKEKELLFTWIDAGAPLDVKPPSPQIPGRDPQVPLPDIEVLNYEIIRKEVLTPRCISCHSNEGGNRGKVNLETYENVATLASEISKAIESGSMPRPRNKPLTIEQKNMILKWIQIGFPEK